MERQAINVIDSNTLILKQTVALFLSPITWLNITIMEV